MHPVAYELAMQFYNTFCRNLTKSSVIVDFGSYDVNGTLKGIFERHTYIGIDMAEGPNVDIVCANDNTPFEPNSVDVVVSSSCFEHDECFWMTFLEMCRIVKPGGYIYINAPSAGEYHGHPGDCWRFYKDSWAALAKWAAKQGYSMTIVYSHLSDRCSWKDNIGIFRKCSENETQE